MDTTISTGPVDSEVVKRGEFIASVSETARHAVAALRRKFEESPEGKEAAYLESDVLKGIVDDETFLERFLGGSPGRRGINQLISYLKESGGQIAKDEKLAKKLQKLADDVEKRKLPDVNELRYFARLEREVRDMSLSSDLRNFTKQFQELLAKSTEYKDSAVAVKVLEEPPRGMPNRIILENYRNALLTWQLIQSRLVLPHAPFDFTDKEKFTENLARLAKKNGAKDLWAAAGLPNDAELEQWSSEASNWVNFDKAVKEKRKNYVFFELLAKSGQADAAEEILLKNINEGRERFLHLLDMYIHKMVSRSEMDRVKSDAVQEYTKIIADMLAEMRKTIHEERKVFVEEISDRVTELKSEHAKKLKEAEEIEQRIETPTKKAEVFSKICEYELQDVEKIDGSIRSNIFRAFSIMKVMRARQALQRRMLNVIDDSQFNRVIGELMSSGPEVFAINMIRVMKERFDAMQGGSLTGERFQQEMKKVDDAIDNLKLQQLPYVQMHLLDECDRQVERSDEFSIMRDRSRRELDRSYDESLDGLRRLRRLGLEGERYSYDEREAA
jgi:hypothetical protein